MKVIQILKHGFSDLMKIFIIMNNQYPFTNKPLSYIIFSMGQLKNSSYIIYKHYRSQTQYNQIYQLISCFSRPSIIINGQYLFIAPFILIIIIFSTMVYQLTNYLNQKEEQFKQKITLKNYLFKQKKLIRLINMIAAFIYEFYQIIIINLLFEITLTNIQDQLNINTVFITITLLLYSLLDITKLLINQNQLQYQITIQSKFSVTPLDILLHALNYLQIFLYTFYSINQMYQVTTTFIISILMLINIMKNFHYLDQNAYIIIIQSQSLAIILSFTEYLTYFFDVTHDDFGIFQLIALPLIVNIFQQMKITISVLKIYNRHTHSNIIFQILFQYLESNNHPSKQPFYLYVQKKHQSLCQNCNCSQKQQNYDIYLKLSTDTYLQSTLVNDQIIQMILIHIYTKNYIQAYSLCSSVLEQKDQMNINQNNNYPYKFIMKNSSMSVIQSINYQNNFHKPMYYLYQIIYSYLREESKQLLKARLRKNFSRQYDQTTLIFEEFYKTEYIIRILNLQMVQLLEDKCILYEQLIKDQVQENKIFDRCFTISIKLCKIEKNINHIYLKNPSISILNLKIFYQTEILRNYAQAGREHSIIYELESQYKQASIVQLAKQNKVAFLITKLGDCSYNVKIERASSNAKLFFQNELPQYIEPLIPQGIRDYHGENLHDFFQTGQSPRYKQNARLFILQKSFIQIAESYLDSYNSLSELRFINIILELKDIKGYMILNNQLQIMGINKNLLDLLNFSKSQVEYFQPDEMIYGLNILILIPQFLTLIQENRSQSLIEFYFIKQCYIFDLTKHTMIERFTNINLLDRYESQIEIQCKYHNNQLAYLIITFDYLKRQNATSLLSNFIECSTKSNQKIDLQQKLQEGIKIDSPYDFEDSKDLDVQLFQPELTYQQLNSPQEKSSTYELLFQQKFYNRYHDISRESDEVSIVKKNFTKQASMPQFYSENNKQKQSVQDVCTPQKKKEKYDSYFSDKVDFIDKMGQKKITNKFVRLAIIFLVVSSLIGIVSLLLQTFLIQNNFNNYITDVGQLSIKSDILQPMLSFFILRFIIYDKTNLLSLNLITKEQFLNETDFAFQYLKKEYDHFHHHIQELFRSQIIQDLLYDHYYQVRYLQDDYSYKYENFSARTFFIKYLDYQQFIFSIYSNNELPKINTPVTYQLLNQQLMFEICYYLSEQIYNNTITRNSKQINDQIIVIACFLSVNFICLLLSNYYYRKFASQRQIFGNMMYNIEKSALESELEYLDFLINQIQNHNITQFYSFNEKLKEREIQALQQKTKTHYQSHQKQIHKKTKINTTMFLIFIYTMFIGFLTVNLSNTLILSEFIQKYKPTATMHKNTSDLCLSVALIYTQKEKLNNQVFFQYFKESDFSIMIQQLNESSIQIKQYQQELLNVNLINLLFHSDFVSYFLDQQAKDLCPLINSQNNQKIKEICLYSFEGSFLLGIQAILNHVSKIITQELISQNFTQRKPINTLEVEGAYIFVEYLQIAADMAMKDFSEQVLKYQSILETILILSISFTLILVAIILIAFETNLKLKLIYAIKYIHLIPREVLFLDNSFERKIRMAILKDPNL